MYSFGADALFGVTVALYTTLLTRQSPVRSIGHWFRQLQAGGSDWSRELLRKDLLCDEMMEPMLGEQL